MSEICPREHVATGGTIDSVWSPEHDGAIPAPLSVVAEYYQFLADNGFPSFDTETLIMKDSRAITIADKNHIAMRVAESRYPNTIVTSGTYLMREIGERIQRHAMSRHFDRFRHRVVMASSLIPIEGFLMSDGGFNLGMGHAAFDNSNTPYGVVGVANGVIAPIGLLEKDLTTASFEPLDPAQTLLGYENYSLIPAGGTIDFEINGMDGLEPSHESAIPGYLRDNVRTNVLFHSTPPILKDSRLLTPQDMDLIVDMLRESPSEHNIVTAGLLRMAELRKVIDSGLHTSTDRERRVLLTGSKYMLRMAGSRVHGFTEAPYNLGYAHGRLGDVAPGVHIAITGRVLDKTEDPAEICYTPEELERLQQSIKITSRKRNR